MSKSVGHSTSRMYCAAVNWTKGSSDVSMTQEVARDGDLEGDNEGDNLSRPNAGQMDQIFVQRYAITFAKLCGACCAQRAILSTNLEGGLVRLTHRLTTRSTSIRSKMKGMSGPARIKPRASESTAPVLARIGRAFSQNNPVRDHSPERAHDAMGDHSSERTRETARAQRTTRAEDEVLMMVVNGVRKGQSRLIKDIAVNAR